jgi:uncharacterized membrane protein YoaK (UPF0700 family)
MDPITSVVVWLIAFVVGYVIKEIIKIDFLKLIELYTTIAIVLPAIFGLFSVVSNPTIISTDVTATYIGNLLTEYVYLVVDIPALIAGAIFSSYIKPRLEDSSLLL